MGFIKQNLAKFLILFTIFGSKAAFAYNFELTYENFYRLNKPLNYSDTGDWLGAGLKTAPTKEGVDYFFDGDFRYYFQDDNTLNYSLQEAYVQYQKDDFKLAIGRKILDWNTNEKYWFLGYLNALQSFTLLSTEEEGVSGIFVSKQFGNWEFDVLFSYFYIPQLNPAMEFKNGEIRSKSEWMRLPPKKTVVSGSEVPIYYKITDYKITDIVFNKSLGMNVRYNWDKGGVAAFAIYKPEHRLRSNADAYYDTVAQKVMVTADPTVNHHAYYGVQIFQAFGDIKARGGISYVDPNAKLGKDFLIDISNGRKKFSSQYFKIDPRYDREAYSHMSLNYDKQKSYKLSLNYIHLLTNNVRGSDDFFSDTVKWKRTVGINYQYYFTDNFTGMFDVKYDFTRKDNIFHSELAYMYRDQIRLSLGLEILKAPDSNSYWSYYRTNDTLYSSIGFIF